MSEREPKRHHFVPRFYLARWSVRDLVDVRRRDGKRFHASSANVAAINGFYDFRDDDGQVSKEVEKYLADEVEGPAAAAIAAIDIAHQPPPIDTVERDSMANFIAFQMTRTPERREDMLLAESVRDFLGGRELSHDLMAEYLETVHLGFAASESEVRATMVFVGYQHAQFTPSTPELTMRIMYSTAQTLAPRLAAMHWSLVFDRNERLITADQPVLVWRRPTSRDRFEGVGIENAEEVRLPLGPGTQLVLRHRPKRATVHLTAQEVRDCNDALARRCHLFVVGSPRRSASLDALELEARGPRMRFNIGPAYVRGDGGRLIDTGEEVLHTWVSRDVGSLPPARRRRGR